MYKDKFVLSILYNDKPVKETGPFNSKQVALPFGAEYKIRLKNKNSKACTARVFIDGKQVSMLGDFIIQAYGTLDLERFVDSSLTKGRKFKFVELSHPDVDDPTSEDNGIIRVEFRLATSNDPIFLIDKKDFGPKSYNVNYTFNDNIIRSYVSNSSYDLNNHVCSSLTSNGATIEGDISRQKFSYSELNVIDNPTVLQLRLVGIEQEDVYIKNYCTKCGNKIRQIDNYCSRCGSKV